ncbi:hypothetical protein DER44DRAFT_821205 [Fusarium oxysporum]|nr:hypothetical protein DER44DRAFT_821205 [Fusarium oxysporum]
MVILPQILGLCLSIWVAYQPAEEYYPPHITPVRGSNLGDEVAATHCFIESHTGKNLHIRYRVSPLFTLSDGAVAIILKFFIDGIECQQLVMNHEDLIGARDKIQIELAKGAGGFKLGWNNAERCYSVEGWEKEQHESS